MEGLQRRSAKALAQLPKSPGSDLPAIISLRAGTLYRKILNHDCRRRRLRHVQFLLLVPTATGARAGRPSLHRCSLVGGRQTNCTASYRPICPVFESGRAILSEDKGNGKLVKIGGALIILAAFGIMLPAIFQYVAGIGRMVILIVVALGFAYLLNMMMARQALERVRRAKAAAAGSAAGGSSSTAGGSSNAAGGSSSAAGGSSSAAGGSSNAEGGSGNAGANSNHSQETNGKSGGGDSNETAEKN